MLKYNCALNDLYICVYMCPVVPLVGNDVPLFLLIDSLPQNPAKLSIKVCEQMRKKKKENVSGNSTKVFFISVHKKEF